MMKKCGGGCGCSKLGFWLVIIGALNWGLVGFGQLFGLGNWNVVNLIFGSLPWLEAIVYLLVGLSGIIMLTGCRCKKCKGMKGGDKKMMNHSSDMGGGMNN